MGASGRNIRWICVLLLASICTTAAPGILVADDRRDSGEDLAKSASKNPPAANAAASSPSSASGPASSSSTAAKAASAEPDSSKSALATSTEGNPASGKTENPPSATSPSAPSASAGKKWRKIDAPEPGLTERERMLLDRVEELEKRVADLEATKQPAANSSSTATAEPAGTTGVFSAPSANVPAGAATGSTVADIGRGSAASLQGHALSSSAGTTVNPETRSGGTELANSVAATGESSSADGGNAISRDRAMASIGPQATEKGKSSAPNAKPGAAKEEPFSFADFTWLNGNARTKESPMDTKFFTPEIRADVDYVYDFNHPKDDTIGGSSEVFRSNEVHVTQLGVGGDFHYDNVRARLMTQFGLYSQTTPRNDGSPSRGQWNLDNAYRYVSEAYGGYHFNVLHGINVDAGIFMSYIGLFSYYNFDNWAYQPSYVSSNTPWFFNGVRVQIFPTAHLKIEPWFVNGWQSYGRFNGRPGFGLQVLWRPNGWFSVLGNEYLLGEDALNTPGRVRYHSDDSIEIKYYDKPDNALSKMAFSLTGDIGCEHGGGVSCYGNSAKGPKQDFLGFMLYNRFWFNHDKFGLTLGGGKINNPGRYLVLLPPINGATAASGTPYFTENPGDPFKAWDASGTFDYMPSQYITFRWEFDHRAANVPYFSGPGGVTPTSCPTAPVVENICGSPGALVPGFTPDLKKIENRIDLAILVKF
jgi:Putative beta-barrel porin-2, OmpL-like. bbp2